MDGQSKKTGNATNLAAAVQILLEKREWREILRATDDFAAAAARPRSLVSRLTAAMEVGDEDRIAQTVRDVTKAEIDDRIKFACARELSRTGRHQAAVMILLDSPGAAKQPQFLQVLSRYRNKVDGALRARLLAALDRESKGGDTFDLAPSGFHFSPIGDSLPLFGSADADRASHVGAQHLAEFENEARRFRRGAGAPVQPRIGEYHDVFVDRWGQIWTEDGAVIRSFGRPVAEHRREAVPSVELGLNLLKATRGIYHWLIDRVPLMAWLKTPQAEDVGAVRLLLKEDAPEFETATLELAGLPADRIVFVGDAVFVRRLIIAEVGFRGMIGWSHIDPILAPIVRASRDRAASAGLVLPRRIFIGRGKAARRPLTNAGELEAAMQDRGFSIQDFAEIPLWHQVAMVANAEIVVGPHGAGLSHLLLAAPGTRVIELIPIIEGTYQLRFNYARLAIIKGLDYAAWLEEQPPDTDRWTATLQEFLPFLDARLAEPSRGTDS